MMPRNSPGQGSIEMQFLAGIEGGDMGRAAQAFDWAATPLGPPSDWPAEMKSAIASVLESRFPVALVCREGLITIYNDAFLPILGDKKNTFGSSFAEIWSEAWAEIGPLADRAFSGTATFIEDFPLLIDRNGCDERAYFTFCYSPLRTSDGTVIGMLDTVMETTARVRAEAEAAVLTQELGHRLKNTMAMVLAIATQSLKHVDQREAVDNFQKRIVALGSAHDVLQRKSWTEAPTMLVVEAVLAPHDRSRFNLSGRAFDIGAKAALSMSLLLHELATNALKYGALSAEAGSIDIKWSVENGKDGEEFVLNWNERGGPPPTDPTRTGFGSRLINMGLVGTGKVRRHYGAGGFEAEFRAPLGVMAPR